MHRKELRKIIWTLFVLCLCGPGATAFAAQAPDFAAAQQEAVKLLTELVRINSSNPPGHETQVAQFIKQTLEREGIPCEIFEKVPGRGTMVARLKGNGSRKPLLLMAHEDVVGVERDKWTVDPFG
ncbi:MAG TPA: peptidase M20, partial [Terriglobia bacterium]|nr:peptidase M20 [Terriglobia bacterium]